MITSQCTNCVWFFPVGTNVVTCAAFAPAVIPEEIITGRVGHDKVREDQNDQDPQMVFTPLIDY